MCNTTPEQVVHLEYVHRPFKQISFILEGICYVYSAATAAALEHKLQLYSGKQTGCTSLCNLWKGKCHLHILPFSFFLFLLKSVYQGFKDGSFVYWLY